MAREYMALRLEETSSTVDTMQHVVASQSVTRQTKTLHGIKGEMARTVQEPCERTVVWEDVRNVILPKRTCCHRQRPRDRIQYGGGSSIMVC